VANLRLTTSEKTEICSNSHNEAKDIEEEKERPVSGSEVKKKILEMNMNMGNVLRRIGAEILDDFIVYDGTFQNNMRKLELLIQTVSKPRENYDSCKEVKHKVLLPNN